MHIKIDNPIVEKIKRGLLSKPLYLTCTKTVKFELIPFGNFHIKWKRTDQYDKRLNWLYVGEISLDQSNAMPLTQKQKEEFIEKMENTGTDVFYRNDNNIFPNFYTYTGSGITPIKHERLIKYWNELKKES